MSESQPLPEAPEVNPYLPLARARGIDPDHRMNPVGRPPPAPTGFAPTPLAELFGDGGHRFQMRLDRVGAAGFFASSAEHVSLLEQRQQLLRTAPEIHAALSPEGEPLFEEVARLAREWHGFSTRAGASPWETCLALGEFWEPDFLLMRPDSLGAIRLVGGCLCFPSSWRLADKFGQAIEFIHDPVPGLNTALGPAIHKFLTALKPGAAWHRANWGLSRSAELNQHPDRGLPRLDATVSIDDVWVRIEEQALVGLSGGILFGIRIMNQPLADVRMDPVVAAKLAQTLNSMPETMARYKGLLTARPRLIELLTEGRSVLPA